MNRPLDADAITSRLTTGSGRWQRIEVWDTIDSTNTRSEVDPTPWRLITAAQQSAGRGRHDRAWLSPAGASISLSATVPIPARVGPALFPLLVGLAVRNALTAVGGPHLHIGLKWPNDVLDGSDRKLCGILCQLLPGNLLLAGIGVNVGSSPQIAAALADGGAATPPTPAVALADLLGRDVAREDVVVAVASALDAAHRWWQDAGDAAVRDAYRAACATLGRDVVVHRQPEPPLSGRVLDIDEGGALVVQDARTGTRHVFMAGDVVHVRPGNGA